MVDSLPHVNLGQDRYNCTGSDIVLDAGADYITYKWQDGSINKNFTVDKPGEYNVQIKNSCGFANDTITISEYKIFIPNLITPGNDEHNETLQISGLGNNQGALNIYNLWGEEVYKSKLYKNDWNASGLEEGIYYYTFSYHTCKPQKGWIQIIK